MRTKKKRTSKQPQVPRKPNEMLIYRTVGIERRMFMEIDALDLKGYRGISGKVRYLVERGLKAHKET